MQEAWGRIAAKGGPQRFGKNGHCTTCQQQVEDLFANINMQYFSYEMQASSAGLPVGLPGLITVGAFLGAEKGCSCSNN